MENNKEMVEIEITAQTNKLLQALLAVTSDDDKDMIIQNIYDHMEKSLKEYLVKRTLESLRDSHGDILLDFAKENYGHVIIEDAHEKILSESSSKYSIASLSSEDDKEWDEAKHGVGVTDEVIARDLEVEDPEHEVAAEALPYDIEDESDMLKILNDQHIVAEEIPARKQKEPKLQNAFEARRKKTVKTNAIVSRSASPVTDLGGGSVA
jgi:hypothetical protein